MHKAKLSLSSRNSIISRPKVRDKNSIKLFLKKSLQSGSWLPQSGHRSSRWSLCLSIWSGLGRREPGCPFFPPLFFFLFFLLVFWILFRREESFRTESKEMISNLSLDSQVQAENRIRLLRPNSIEFWQVLSPCLLEVSSRNTTLLE